MDAGRTPSRKEIVRDGEYEHFFQPMHRSAATFRAGRMHDPQTHETAAPIPGESPDNGWRRRAILEVRHRESGTSLPSVFLENMHYFLSRVRFHFAAII